MKKLISSCIVLTCCLSHNGYSQDFKNSLKMSYLFIDNIYRNPSMSIGEGVNETEVLSSSGIKVSGVSSTRIPWRKPNIFRKRKSWTDIEFDLDIRAYQANPQLNIVQYNLDIQNRHRWNKRFITRLSTNVSIKNADPSAMSRNRRINPFASTLYHINSTQDFTLGHESRLWLDTYYEYKNYTHRSSLDRTQYGAIMRYRYPLTKKKKEFWRISASTDIRYYLNQIEPGVFDEDIGLLDDPMSQRKFTYATLKSSVELKPIRSIRVKTGVQLEQRAHYGSGKLSYQDLGVDIMISQSIAGFIIKTTASASRRDYSNYMVNEEMSLTNNDRKISFSLNKILTAGLELGVYLSHFSRSSNNPISGSLFFDGYSLTQMNISMKYDFSLRE